MTDREAMKMALHAMRSAREFLAIVEDPRARLQETRLHDAMREVRTALARSEQEPCNWVVDESVEGNITMSWMLALPMPVGTKLYTAPPQRPWQWLTDEERQSVIDETHQENRWTLAERVEFKLKEKNT